MIPSMSNSQSAGGGTSGDASSGATNTGSSKIYQSDVTMGNKTAEMSDVVKYVAIGAAALVAVVLLFKRGKK